LRPGCRSCGGPCLLPFAIRGVSIADEIGPCVILQVPGDDALGWRAAAGGGDGGLAHRL
jgi:hypothetical protein